MTLRLYRVIFVEIHALFPAILRFELVTLFMKHPAQKEGLMVVQNKGVW